MNKTISFIKTKQFGTILVLAGIFIPSILYPFTTVETTTWLFQLQAAQNGGSYNTSLRDLEVIINKGETDKNNRLAIPYRYPVAFGIFLIFIGGCFVVLFKDKNIIYL